jgi:hypothetical protein
LYYVAEKDGVTYAVNWFAYKATIEEAAATSYPAS